MIKESRNDNVRLKVLHVTHVQSRLPRSNQRKKDT